MLLVYELFNRLICFYVSGFTHLVYPGAVHSRFEHSLGVYWIAGQSVEKLNSYQVYFFSFYFIFHFTLLKVQLRFFDESITHACDPTGHGAWY